MSTFERARAPHRLPSGRLTVGLAAFVVLAAVTAAGAVTGSGIRDGSLWSGDYANNSIRTEDIRNNTIRSVDVQNHGLFGIDIRNGSLLGGDIRDGSLTGRDVRNGSLGGRDITDSSLTGTDIAGGSLGAAHLSFDVATQSELDALASPGFLNVPSNKIDWTQLKNVPLGFADGVDDTGAAAGDVACTGCVGATDLADGSITVAELAFDPATQGELDAFGTSLSTAGTINTAGNPVDWTQLKGVPTALTDGDDVDGGTAADLACTGCVAITDLANDAVTGAKIWDGSINIADLGFDPATQAEQNVLSSSLWDPGFINTGTNPVDWTKLKNVPAGLADGDDSVDGGDWSLLTNVPADIADGDDVDGGVAADLVCTGCVAAGDLADGSIALADLAFDPATQGELDALGAAAGTINAPANPVDWTRIKSMPAGFADGIDDVDGGTAVNLVCTGCVDATDLADSSIGVVDLAFDPATQVELNTLSTSLSSPGTINAGTNPVEWTKLESVPAGIADGTDETIVIGSGTAAGTAITAGTAATVEATCSPGDTAIGGSFTSDAAAAGLSLTASQQKTAATDTWQLTFRNDSAGSITVTPSVICLAATADA